MNESKKVFFIINKFSGTGYQDSIEGRIIDTCASLNFGCTIEFTRDRGHATELAQTAVAEKFDMAFAVGGDGTVNEVAQGLVDSPVTMGILPKGSGNGLARHLGVPMKFSGALGLLQSSRVINMDTMSVNGKLSVNVSGIGFDGHIAGLFGKNGKRGLVGYTTLVLKEFMSYREFEADVVLDGKHHRTSSFIIALANSSQFGNNAVVAPLASVCDELIDVCFIRKVPFSRVVGFATKMFSGTLDRSSLVDIRKGKQVSITFPKAVAFHIDGEAQEPASQFDVQITPGNLKMVVPERNGKPV
ncbi:MAG TPA: YegS/Rv2252/BmrU family lipid kinase [Cyclobacteriaceae bacterium]|nr:YegS/Rv2252/BmrU family lipid kinase [Cyclobacteriaceae bacterium]